MKIKLYVLFICILVLSFSCNKQTRYERCQELEAKSFNKVSAVSNYKDFEGVSYFKRISLGDSLNNVKNGIFVSFIEYDDYCLQKEKIIISDIILKIADTIFIESSDFVNDRFPTSDYFIKDHDAILDYYIILPSEEFKSWILIEDVNSDTTEILGKFQLVFTRKDQNYPIWDDPNRPDTIYFTQGKFLASEASK